MAIDALANEPAILLADEPTGSLDSASTERFLLLLEHLCDQGTTIVMVTHDTDVAAHAHRVIEIASPIIAGKFNERLGTSTARLAGNA